VNLADYLDFSKWLDGLLFGLGMFAVWMLAVLGGSIMRSAGTAGGSGLVFAGRWLLGRHQFERNDQSTIVNVTLNTTRGGVLSTDTLVADMPLSSVYQNLYLAMRLRAAGKACTVDDPVVKLTGNGDRTTRAIYDPLINLIAEACTNSNSIDLAIGVPVKEHRFVVALTFEKLCHVRSQHFRAMVIYEPELRAFPDELERHERPETRTRFLTLREVARQYRLHPEQFGMVKVWRATNGSKDV
jgi:hypothetical protein